MVKDTQGNMKPNSKWYGFYKYWRQVAAYAYLVICLFDFVAMPLWVEQFNRRLNQFQIVEQALKFEPQDRLLVMGALMTERKWESITGSSGGLVHISFLAILGVTAGGAIVSNLSPRKNDPPGPADESLG